MANASDLFEVFWAAYPRRQGIKTGKSIARKAFNKIKPSDADVDEMITTIESLKKSPQWRKEDGAFIPMAVTWLNQERWEDGGHEAPSGVYAGTEELDF